MTEFELIARYFQRPAHNAVLGIGDDAALVSPQAGQHLVVAADTLVEGRHFFPGTPAYAVGWKTLAVNLSDMAAMGAQPRWFSLCLTLPHPDADWLAGFSQGLFALADTFGVALIGGDTTAGPLTLSIQMLGEVPTGQALRRDGAQPGDDLWLSGSTGAAALAVQHRQGKLALSGDTLAHCNARLDFPQPRVALGIALRGIASAAIDVSDGLLADVGHLAQRSHCAVQVDASALPYPALPFNPPIPGLLQEAMLSGGDDYELCFAAPAIQRQAIAACAETCQLSLTRIGRFQPGAGVILHDANGQPLHLPRTGFDHFSAQ